MPNEAKLKQMLQDLNAPFPEDAIERHATGRGGVKVMHVIMRLNSVCGLGGWRLHKEVTCTEITTPSGQKGWSCVADVVLELVEWLNGTAVTYAEAVADADHISYSSEACGREGAVHNGLRNAASMFGCGWHGVIDEHNESIDGAAPPVATRPVSVANAAPRANPLPPGLERQADVVASRPDPREQSRISARQISAIMAIARRLGMKPPALRARIKAACGNPLEQMTREQASKMIKQLDAELNGAGAESHAAASALAS